MKTLLPLVLTLASLPAVAQSGGMESMHHADAAKSADRLGTVSFSVSCLPATQASFNRGVALLHDFWYEEAHRQFEEIAKDDPGCAMAHWGIAMSQFHQIWDRPDESMMAKSWAEIQKAQSPQAKSEREREYIAALNRFFRPDKVEYQVRIDEYSGAMAKLYRDFPGDVDAGALYALSLLAAEKQNDTSLTQEQRAMAVLTPLFAKYPDNPGVVHYIIHSCDNPAMAAQGLAASDHYGEIAPSGAHAVHMPGHIYARLGMWPQDIASNLGAVAAAKNAEANGKNGIMDEPHAYDFLLYAYLQSGQDTKAQAMLDQSSEALTYLASMPAMGSHRMEGMVPYYRTKLPAFYALEMRNWKKAGETEPAPGSPPHVATLAYWARGIAHGHLRQSEQAQADLAKYDDSIAEIKKGKHAYYADGMGVEIERGELSAWVDFAAGKPDGALKKMREAADLQDKVGQAEVDIPAREMLADMFLELHRPQEAVVEYDVALKLSPNRFNGLYNAGIAAEEAGDKARAERYYALLLKSTDNGAQSSRPELAHVKSFVSSTQFAVK